MASPAIRWIEPPSKLAKAIEQYGEKVMVAVKALADFVATEAQNDMRSNAPWTDRTGNARSGLYAEAERFAKHVVVIHLSHGVDYGIWLEIKNGGRYAIVAPTLERLYPRVRQLLNQLFD